MRTMKKMLAGAVALTMALTMNVAVFAQGTVEEGTTKTTIAKEYQTTKGVNATVTPAEALTFTVTPGTNPDTDTITVSKAADSSNIMVNYSDLLDAEVGLYTFTVTENTGNTQGVTYNTETYTVNAMVSWTDESHTTKKVTSEIKDSSGEDKIGGSDSPIINTFDYGSLAVSKQVTGNLSDTTDEFDVTVTFTSEKGKEVKNAISYTDGTEQKTIAATDWSNGTATATITLTDDETVTFTGIPAGVTYTVREADYTSGDVNTDNYGYDDPTYTYSDETGKKISADDADTVQITNNKGSEIDTGISTDSLPYFLIAAGVAAGAAVLVTRRRRFDD